MYCNINIKLDDQLKNHYTLSLYG